MKNIARFLGKTGNKINKNIASPWNYYLQQFHRKGCGN